LTFRQVDNSKMALHDTPSRAVPFSGNNAEEKELSGLKSGVVIRKGIKVRAVHSDPARRVKVNLSQLVRGFPGRSICLRRYIQEMKFLERSDSTARVAAWGCAYREGSASKPITWPRYPFSSSTRTSDIDGRDRANGKRRGSARQDRLAPDFAIYVLAGNTSVWSSVASTP